MGFLRSREYVWTHFLILLPFMMTSMVLSCRGRCFTSWGPSASRDIRSSRPLDSSEEERGYGEGKSTEPCFARCTRAKPSKGCLDQSVKTPHATHSELRLFPPQPLPSNVCRRHIFLLISLTELILGMPETMVRSSSGFQAF